MPIQSNTVQSIAKLLADSRVLREESRGRREMLKKDLEQSKQAVAAIRFSSKGISVSEGKKPDMNYSIQGSYRNQAYSAVMKQDPSTKSWAWKGYVDFDAGCHSMLSSRNFATAIQAEEHMRQAALQCIDNRLG